MLPPDIAFIAHTTDRADKDGFYYRGTSIKQFDAKAANYPKEWKTKDFAFAAFNGDIVHGLKQVQLGERTFYAFACDREHCEELIVFRHNEDLRRKWDDDELDEAKKVGRNIYLMVPLSQLKEEDTPMHKNFFGEWGFYESFFVPLLENEQSGKSISMLDSDMCEDFFAYRRHPVQFTPGPAPNCLRIPDDLEVRYEVKVVCKELEDWSKLVHIIDEDMHLMKDHLIEYKHLKKGDTLVGAFHEQLGHHGHARRTKRDLEHLKLPVVATFDTLMKVADYEPDKVTFDHKYDNWAQLYSGNYMGGYSTTSGAKSDPWHPMARIAISALEKVVARHDDIRSIMDLGCGEMTYMRYFLEAHPYLQYIGVELMPYPLAVNYRKFPRLQFVQSDLSNDEGIEVLPEGIDLVFAKDLFQHMILPDLIKALKRILALRPRFLLTHIHTDADNTGWERAVDRAVRTTKYDFSKPPFSLPYPTSVIHKISEDQYYVLYEIVPSGKNPTTPQIASEIPPAMKDTQEYITVQEGNPIDAPFEPDTPLTQDEGDDEAVSARGKPMAFKPPDRERTIITPVVTELSTEVPVEKPGPERLPIKGIPAVEFRARCDVIFAKYDQDRDDLLSFEELCSLMESAGRPVEEYDSYARLCKNIDCEPNVGLTKKHFYKFAEIAPQEVWDEMWRIVDPLTMMVRRGAQTLPETALMKPIPDFFFRDEEETWYRGQSRYVYVLIEVNIHMFYGAHEMVDDSKWSVFFGRERMEVHIVCPETVDIGGTKPLYCWKLVIAKLSHPIIPEDSFAVLKDVDGRFGAKLLEIKMAKEDIKKWYKVGLPGAGMCFNSMRA
eukprot:gnl/MRDRNA2_/MRDRNA2_139355_c0_seq1.p1 gnl/MRDRNA2_/MRDRNA2_139355_c0~~gnl/MRDRNA2_/MRDRNA2_139355_c0_seq1.p1  ORF type:complete len:833 (-),score=142.94 gnl/MRDRNA2_/MRDRNA2_139355_c0_seq1:27-2525(-)